MNITFSSRFVFYIQFSSRFCCPHMQLRLLIMPCEKCVAPICKCDAFVYKEACEDTNCPLRFGQAECFHCKRCWFCCNQKFTICKLCGTRECDQCCDYGNAVSNGIWSNQCYICEAQADPRRGWRLKVYTSFAKKEMTETMLEEALSIGPPPIDRNKKFSLPTAMTSTQLDQWIQECKLNVS
jgi:hypothetical protein